MRKSETSSRTTRRKVRRMMDSPCIVERFHRRAREVEKAAKEIVDEEGIRDISLFKRRFPETYEELNAFGLVPSIERYMKYREYLIPGEDRI